jgi:16S rRNA (cytosine967-C5)-methyltransferase
VSEQPDRPERSFGRSRRRRGGPTPRAADSERGPASEPRRDEAPRDEARRDDARRDEPRRDEAPGAGSAAPGSPGTARPSGRPAGRGDRPNRPPQGPRGEWRGNARGPRDRGPRPSGDRRPPRPRREERPRTGQAYAENRSRPIYDTPARGRWRKRPGTTPRPDPRQARPVIEEREPPPLPRNPREAALRILHAADTRSAFSDRLLDGAHARGGPDERDQALLHELVKGTLRWRGRLDWVLDQLVHIGLSQVQPWVKNILRMGAYQILFLDRVPAHAAVDESVKLAHQYGHPGTAGLVNSVLRRLVEQRETLTVPQGDDPESLAVWGSHPLWLTEQWLERFGPEALRELMMANNRPARVGLRTNRLKVTREQLIEKLAAEGVQAEPARWSPDLIWLEPNVAPARLAAFKQGLCTAQDESEALVARLLAPQPHERLLDLCAAPGGKCTHLAELMGDEGEVWAMERVESRAASLQATVDRLGTHAVHVVQGDGRSYTFPMPFDRVLVDAPCSGLGVLARRADARWRKGPEVFDEMPPIQHELLVSGGRRARPGGVLVYSVCSFEPEETTEVVERFLREQPSFVLESAAGVLPDEVVDEQGFMRVLPHVHGCDGAFAARFRRT